MSKSRLPLETGVALLSYALVLALLITGILIATQSLEKKTKEFGEQAMEASGEVAPCLPGIPAGDPRCL